MSRKPAILALANGTYFLGTSVGAEAECVGELVFNTSMTGCQEMLSDPSYARQIINLTAPHVGNVGCNEEDMESSRIWASGLVLRKASPMVSNYRSQYSLFDWLRQQNIPAIADVDTRQLTLILRDEGAMGACISSQTTDPGVAVKKAKAFAGLDGMDLAKEVSRKTTERWHNGRGEWVLNTVPPYYHVVVYDFGVKHSILRILVDKGCHVTIVPAQTPAQEVMALNPDGILLSNGPGDPLACDYAIVAARDFIKQGIPVFGICLGFQILALALGAKTTKMKFGHHGANHPVIETSVQKRVFITSQNHGFAVMEDSLPKAIEVTHRSLFDQSLQGIRHKTKPVFGFQGHPEASPGPHDIELIFDEFIAMLPKKTVNNKEKRSVLSE